MKKTLLSLTLTLFGLCANAQVDNTFVFTNAEGKEIADGSVIVVTDKEEDEWTEGILMHSGLYVKNVSDAPAYAGMQIDIQTMDNGSLKHCFPGLCQFFSTLGKQEITGVATIAAGAKVSIQSEWVSENDGLCTVVYTIRVMAQGFGNDYVETAKGPSVTVHYCNGKYPAAIDQLSTLNSQSSTPYNLQGQPVGKNFRGIVIRNGKKHVQ